MPTPVNYKAKSALFLFIVVIVVATTTFNACNDDQVKNTSANTDSTAAANTADTSAAKTVKKSRKGKVSTMMAMDSDNSTKIEKNKDGVYARAEKMPQYPGGEAALSKFIEENIVYPQDALDQNKEGTAKVSFIIDEKGAVTKATVTGSTSTPSLDNEAARVVNQMPPWKPGVVKGKNVKTSLELPITFKLVDL